MSDNIPKLTVADLALFTGDHERFRHSFVRRVIYTPGVQFLAQRAGAYWLIDAIALHLVSKAFENAAKANEMIGRLHFWTLKVNPDHSAELCAKADKHYKPFFVQAIEYTDFPLPRIDIWAGFDGGYWTLYLPSEH